MKFKYWNQIIKTSLFMFILCSAPALQGQSVTIDNFERPDALHIGDQWESINPGYWQIQDESMRRRLTQRGNRHPGDWFPWHWETHRDRPMPVMTDPSLPYGMIWRRDWKLTGNYTIRTELTVESLALTDSDPEWKDGEPLWRNQATGYGLMGVCFGGATLFESWDGGGQAGDASWMAIYRDDGTFGLFDHNTDGPDLATEIPADDMNPLQTGDQVTLTVDVSGADAELGTLTITLSTPAGEYEIEVREVNRRQFLDGYFGIVGRGHLDFSVDRISLEPGDNQPLQTPQNPLHICYPLGDQLNQVNGQWQVPFVALFRDAGESAIIRISDSAQPSGGWNQVPVAGEADIITNGFRRNSAIIHATLPHDPSERTMFYTVWRDGENVTGDPRIGTASIAPGTGHVPTHLSTGDYVGRLPQLKAPYRLAGLGGHAIHGGRPNLENWSRFQENWVHDQPTPNAYEHFEEYDFQILLWDDDVWYLELLFPPPSSDDAYKVITHTIANPVSRWQMMRHWNVIHPGDHDYGMDDVKGPEQWIIRQHPDLGQDAEYMRRNYEIVHHLAYAEETPSGTENPKAWRRWKMPDEDFSVLVTDPRLWRTTQETDIWDEWGWGHKKNIFDRTDPTRTLLGEEQFAWLQEMIRTDSSPLICVMGINNLHPVFQGYLEDPETGLNWNQADRVAADYAGWVKAGCDRVIDLFGSRSGIVSVYGDIHLAHVLENRDHRFFEASFGPIGRLGSRAVKEDWAPEMTDYDSRPVRIHSLYHDEYQSPELEPRTGPNIWNFLEMTFDPLGREPEFTLGFRNIIDAPGETIRGGKEVQVSASETGRTPLSRLPNIKTLPDANVQILTRDGRPVRGTRTLPNGRLVVNELPDITPGTELLLVTHAGDRSHVQIVRTLDL